MKQVWKYQLSAGDGVEEFHMPADAKVVHVQAPYTSAITTVNIWVEVSNTEDRHTRRYCIYGTGHPVPDDAEYVGTALCDEGHLVWHVYRMP